LRHPRGRQGGGRPHPGPPADPAAGAVGPSGPHRGRGGRAAGAGPDPAPGGRAGPGPVTRRPTSKIAAYVGGAALALLAGLALGRPELVAVAAPLAVLVVAGLTGTRDPLVDARVGVDRERALVGDEVTVELALRAATGGERLEGLLVVPPGMVGPAGGSAWAVAVSLAAGEERTLTVALTCRRWGAYWLGDVHLRAHDRFRLFTWERRLEQAASLKVFPLPETLRALVRPLQTQLSTGSHVAAQRGDGIEFADLRPFLPRDRPRSINWRAPARRGGLMVNQRHPERATEVVLFLDSFQDGRGAAGGTLDRAVGAAASLAAAYLRQRDRVGLVSFGGFVQWLQAGRGQAPPSRLCAT